MFLSLRCRPAAAGPNGWVADGADIIDIGAESSRPYGDPRGGFGRGRAAAA